MSIDIGIKEDDRKNVASSLEVMLADTYLLYLKTQNYHWNVTGQNFHSLHKMFEEQYLDLAEAVDLIAERIRALGFPAPGSFAEFLQLTNLTEASKNTNAEDMLKHLQQDNESMIRSMRNMIDLLENAKDEETLDMVITRLSVHEKTA